ncbi:phage neck terminator protein [Metabacillus litoralis]|uniref:phage neck terminator protein n=1 Tax=Metabacillus litoralis TaxID=152268 RepID=UPI002041F79A|nr:hypothetical protein [Metabacillus litoralis]MCM3413523.1 hypothetical protein [Metabacillus litoralis]
MNAIIAKIFQDTQIRIVEANQNNAPTLTVPYGIYNITSPFIKGVGTEDVTYQVTETNLEKKRTEQYKQTVSFTFYGTDNETTIDLANKVRQWFLFFGEEFIQSKNITVVSIGNIQNRTTFLVDSYEYKHGFDVQFRLSEELTKNVDFFDKVTI